MPRVLLLQLARVRPTGWGLWELFKSFRRLSLSLRPPRASPELLSGPARQPSSSWVRLLGTPSDPWSFSAANRLCAPARLFRANQVAAIDSASHDYALQSQPPPPRQRPWVAHSDVNVPLARAITAMSNYSDESHLMATASPLWPQMTCASAAITPFLRSPAAGELRPPQHDFLLPDFVVFLALPALFAGLGFVAREFRT